MNINHQFPPSSPLLNEPESDDGHCKDAFDKQLVKPHLKSDRNCRTNAKDRDDAYLTPDPSSSLGDFTTVSDHSEADESIIKSSPSKPSYIANSCKVFDDVKPVAKKTKLDNAITEKSSKIDKTNPLSPANFKNVIYVPLNGDVFKVGRSGMSCSFKLNSENKLISRIHAEIQYEQSSGLIVLKCLGFNGLNITIPKSIKVENIKNQEYLISTGDLIETDDESTHDLVEARILAKTPSFTNFYMLKGETIKMPMIEGTVVDFRGDLALLSYTNELARMNSTMQTMPTTHESTSGREPRKLSTSELSNIVEQKKLQFSTHPTLNEMQEKNLAFNNKGARPIERNDLSNTIIYKRPSPVSTPSPITTPNNTPVKQASKLSLKRDTNLTVATVPIQRKPLFDLTNRNKSTSKATIDAKASSIPPHPLQKAGSTPHTRETTPIASRESTMNASKSLQSTPVKEPVNTARNDIWDEQKKRGRPKKSKQTEEEVLRSMPKEDVDAILSCIPELDDISNIITNQIAYSRVLQTPFSAVKELSSIKKHNLSELQLRCILIHHIACIGVIFRHGKDAAGKQLDEEYYYVPENDSDKQRVMLVEDLKGSSSHLRSCRKTHKQYFWKKPKI